MSNIQAFHWGEIALSQVAYINGVPHITPRAVGEWLEYGDPVRAVSKLIERNPHLDHYSEVVNLTTTDGKKYDTRVYHPIGFLLIVMESGQPRAQEMKRAVAEFVWSFCGPRTLSPKEVRDVRNQRLNILAKLDRATNPFVRQALLEDLQAVSLSIGANIPPIALLNASDPKQPGLGV